jgi:hypothetical protein
MALRSSGDTRAAERRRPEVWPLANERASTLVEAVRRPRYVAMCREAQPGRRRSGRGSPRSRALRASSSKLYDDSPGVAECTRRQSARSRDLSSAFDDADEDAHGRRSATTWTSCRDWSCVVAGGRLRLGHHLQRVRDAGLTFRLHYAAGHPRRLDEVARASSAHRRRPTPSAEARQRKAEALR